MGMSLGGGMCLSVGRLLESRSPSLMLGELPLAQMRIQLTFSKDGKLLAYGSADLSIGLLDSKTLAVRK